jgi:hypothetical protein
VDVCGRSSSTFIGYYMYLCFKSSVLGAEFFLVLSLSSLSFSTKSPCLFIMEIIFLLALCFFKLCVM